MNNTNTTTNAAARDAGQTTLPNYRIYDRTGGGVTEDIYAESLDDAIKQGREWIEAGDWSGGGENEDGGKTCRTITLDCCVREIVRYDDSEDDGEEGEIDEDATAAGQSYDCSGEYSETLPDCEARDGEECEVVSVTEMGDEFGSCSNGGTAYTHYGVCKQCGCYHVEHDPGYQRNPGEATKTVTIKPRDEKSEAWLKEIHEEDGWLPDWLAEYLGCPPTVRMTQEQAREYVAAHDDSDDLDQDELEHAFAAIFGRRADGQDRAEGLWSHLCA